MKDDDEEAKPKKTPATTKPRAKRTGLRASNGNSAKKSRVDEMLSESEEED